MWATWSMCSRWYVSKSPRTQLIKIAACELHLKVSMPSDAIWGSIRVHNKTKQIIKPITNINTIQIAPIPPWVTISTPWCVRDWLEVSTGHAENIGLGQQIWFVRNHLNPIDCACTELDGPTPACPRVWHLFNNLNCLTPSRPCGVCMYGTRWSRTGIAESMGFVWQICSTNHLFVPISKL